MRLVSRGVGEYLVLQDGRECGLIHRKRLSRFDDMAELFLFRSPDERVGSYCAAEHVGPDAFDEMVTYVEGLLASYNLAEIYMATQGRLGVVRSLSGLSDLLARRIESRAERAAAVARRVSGA